MFLFNITTEKTNNLLKHRSIQELNFGVFLRRTPNKMRSKMFFENWIIQYLQNML